MRSFRTGATARRLLAIVCILALVLGALELGPSSRWHFQSLGRWFASRGHELAGVLPQRPTVKSAPRANPRKVEPLRADGWVDPAAGSAPIPSSPKPEAEAPTGYVPGRSFEVVEARTARSKVFRNPDGTSTAHLYEGPVHFKAADGSWRPIDASMDPTPAGASARSLPFRAEVLNGQSPALRVGDATGAVQLGFRSQQPVSAKVSSSNPRMTTLEEVAPGVTLELTTSAVGMEEDIVIRDRSALEQLGLIRQPLVLQGLRPVKIENGTIQFVDTQGVAHFEIPEGRVTDSAYDAAADESPQAPVRFSIVGEDSGPELLIEPDMAFVASEGREFPLRIDPLIRQLGRDSANVDAFASSAYPSTNYNVSRSSAGFYEDKLGFYSGSGANYSYQNYDTSPIANATVTNATWHGFFFHTYSSAATAYKIYPLAAGWDAGSVNWNNKPGRFGGEVVSGTVPKPPAGQTLERTNDITGWVQRWANGTWASNGLSFDTGSDTDQNLWKKLVAAESGGGNVSYVAVTFEPEGAVYRSAYDPSADAPPGVAGAGLVANQASTLSIEAENTGFNTWTPGGSYNLSYHVYNRSGSLVAFDGWRTSPPVNVAPGQRQRFDMNVGPLAEGSYTLKVGMVREGVAWFEDRGIPMLSYDLYVHGPSQPVSPAADAYLADGIDRSSLQVALSVTPQPGVTRYRFEVAATPTFAYPIAATSGWIDAPASGNVTWTTTPGVLRDGGRYYWRVAGRDERASSAFSTVRSFDLDVRQLGHRPNNPSEDLEINGPVSAEVDLASGNVVADVPLVNLPTVAQPLAVTATYNSQSSNLEGYVDDRLPAGAAMDPGSQVQFVQGRKFTGTSSVYVPSASGVHQQYFSGAAERLTIPTGSALEAYVWVGAGVNELMLQFWTGDADGWGHRAFWGNDLVSWGTPGTASRRQISAATPTAGRWVRLVVPAAQVGLDGKQIAGVAFTLSGGEAWFDGLGLVKAGLGPGWSMGNQIDLADISVAGLRQLDAAGAVLSATAPLNALDRVEVLDTSGDSVSFKKTSAPDQALSFAPPPGAQEMLMRNVDGSWQLTAADGLTYQLDSGGVLKSATVDESSPNRQAFAYSYLGGTSPALLDRITEPQGRQVQLTWQSNPALTDYGRLKGLTQWDTDPESPIAAKRAVTLSYDTDSGRLTGITSPGAVATSFAYTNGDLAAPSWAGLLQSVTTPARLTGTGSVDVGTYDFTYGSATIAGDRLTKFQAAFDDGGRRPTLTVGYGAAATTVRFPTCNEPTVDAATDPDCPLGWSAKSTFDARHRETSDVDANGGTDRYAYDLTNRRVASTGPTGRVQETTLDGDGNPVSTRGPEAVDKRAAGSGLMGEYYPTPDLSGEPASTRVDATVDAFWGQGAPPGTTLPVDGFSVRWTGYVQAPTAGAYRFTTSADNGTRLYIDGSLVVDHWTLEPEISVSGTIDLTAGDHRVSLEYSDAGSTAAVHLRWAPPGSGETVIPQAALTAATFATSRVLYDREPNGQPWTGLRGTYWNGQSLSGVPVAAVTETLGGSSGGFDKTWAGNPASGVGADNWSARWTGKLWAEASGAYAFLLGSDEGARLYLDGKLVVDDWGHGGYREMPSAAVDLYRGAHTIQIDFQDSTAEARVRLAWKAPGTADYATVPLAALRPSYGLTTTSIDEDGDRTTYRYDGGGLETVDPIRGLPTDEIENGTVEGLLVPLNEHTSYDAYGRPLSVITPRGMQQGSATDRDKYSTRTWYLNVGEPVPADYPDPKPVASHPSLVDVIEPSGQHTRTEQGESGGTIKETTWTVGDTGAGSTTTYSYDSAGNQTVITGPVVTNIVDGAQHQARVTTTYEPTGLVRTSTSGDTFGGPGRLTTITHDRLGREVRLTDVFSRDIARTFDVDGRLTDTYDQLGRHHRTTYNSRGLPTKAELVNYLDPATTAPASSLVLQQTEYGPDAQTIWDEDGLGRHRTYSYDAAGRLEKVSIDNYRDDAAQPTSRSIVLQQTTYSRSGQVRSERSGGGLRQVDYTYDSAGRRLSATVDPTGVNRRTTFDFDANDNATRIRVSPGNPDTVGSNVDETFNVYDQADRLVEARIRLGDGANDFATSRWQRDIFGNPTQIIDAENRVTKLEYDALGRQTKLIEPPVTVETYGATPQPVEATTLSGYNQFGEQTHQRDAKGNVTVTDYDAGGRRWRINHPYYTSPNGQELRPVEIWSYDEVGNVSTYVSRRSKQTTYRYDSLNRNTLTIDPQVGAQTAGRTVTTYDVAGNQTAQVNQIGARNEWTYDSLDRVRAATQVVRRASGSADRYTTTSTYNDAGDLTTQVNPKNEVSRATYDGAGSKLTSSDPADKQSRYGYDRAGRLRYRTDPLGRTSERRYDRAGRATAAVERAPAADLQQPLTGAILATTSWGYDLVGNKTSETRPRGSAGAWGSTTRWSFNAVNNLTSTSEQVDSNPSNDIATTYGYDANGNLTRLTDGEAHATWLTYQPWDLVQDVVEPATAAHPNPVDRTWTRSYDPGGLAFQEAQPGGVQLQRTYDELGRLAREEASGGGSPAAVREWGWDLAGRQTMVSHPTSPVSIGYDDRNLITDVSGGAGASTYSYDPAGQVTQRTDASGSNAFTWDPRGLLKTLTDPLTAQTQTRSYDDAGQLKTITWPGGAARKLDWDDRGQLKSDTLTDGTNVTTAAHAYTYDDDGNVKTQAVSLPGNPSNGLHAYDYDRAGRLTKWTSPSNVPTPYTWDKAGNRIGSGTTSSSYDERNRLLSGPEGTNTWTARGTLATTTAAGGTTSYTFDSLGRLTRDSTPSGSADYTYDALDRIAARNGTPFTYAGPGIDPVNDGSFTYSRGPEGEIEAIAGQNGPHLAGLNGHGDLAYLNNASGTVTDTAVYDPFGQVAGETGSTDALVGFQGDFTDPTTKKVWMGARWYDPGTSTFLSRDATDGELQTPLSLNRYTYALGDPLGQWDPDGNWPSLRNAWNQVKNGGRAIGQAFSNVVDTATSYFNDFTSAVASSWNWGVSTVRSTARSVSHGARRLGSHARSTARKAWKRATKTASSVKHAARAVGRKVAHAHKTITRNLSKAVHKVERAVKKAVKTATNEVRKTARSYAHAAKATGKWVKKNAGTIAKTVAVVATAAIVLTGCTVATGGAGGPGCVIAAGAAAGAVNGALNCPPGKSIAGCTGKGALVGAAAASVFTGVGAVFGTGVIGSALAGGAAAATDQYLNTGQVTKKGVVVGAALAGGGAALGRVSNAVAGSRAARGIRAAEGPAATRSAGAARSTRAAKAETGGATALKDAAQSCSVNSFTAATPILLASGVEVPISKIHVGDKVLATDPQTGQTEARPVTNVIVHGGEHTMVDVTLADGTGLTATNHHPFWDATTHRFTYAIDLRVGGQVREANGTLLTITAVRTYDQDVTAYNLTVDGIHTYYAGTTPVLVHNSCGPFPDGARVTTNDALGGAEEWLGPNYSETGAGSGRFVSQDGTRVFRMGESDITGAHAGGPHVNFEELVPNPARPGRMMPVNGTHVYLIDP